MATRVVTVTIDGRTTTVRSTDPGRVLNVGPQGPAGADGAAGPTGPTGATGPAGPAGATGATGPEGPQGPAGADGAGVVATVVAPLVLTGDELSLDDSGFETAGAAAAVQANVDALTAADVGALDQATADGRYDALGAAAAAQAASQPLDSDLTAIAALTTTSYGRAFLALADAAAGRTALGLGTAATAATGDFDAAGAAAAAQAASQPLDSDLTALAALSTTSFGRSLLEAANASALRTLAGLVLGTDIYSKSAVDSGFQPLDTDLTAIAALASAANKVPYATGAGTWALADLTAFARTILDDADAATVLATLGAAALASPAFTGNPTAPTQSAGNDSTRIATTAFVTAAVAAGGGGGGGGLLAAAYYNPTGGVVTKTFTTTLTALDTTNLRATFTAPASGKVIVKVGGGRLNPNNSNPHFGVKEGSTTIGTQVLAASNATLKEGPECSFLVTGLTPGNSYSYDFAVADTNLTTASTLQYGYSTSNLADASGPAHIEVWEVPS